MDVCFFINVPQVMNNVKGLMWHQFIRDQMYKQIKSFISKYETTLEKIATSGFNTMIHTIRKCFEF
jgi:hypothetical protein